MAWHHKRYNLSIERGGGVYKTPVVTPFTTHQRGLHCVVCSSNIYGPADMYVFIRIGRFCGHLCDDCNKKKRSVCPNNMKEAHYACIRPAVYTITMLLVRMKIPRDVRDLILKRYLFVNPHVCLHNQSYSFMG